MTSILINGCAMEQVSVLDRGFQYGDGLFETLRVVDGEPLHWTRHMARLSAGCKKLSINLPQPELLLSEAMRLCSGESTAVLKIIITRGMGERGYAPPVGVETTRVLSLLPATTFPHTHASEGVRVRLCDTRLSGNPALAGIKHLNRLEQVLARAEWDREWDRKQDNTEIAEGLMQDENNNIVEGTMSNLFCVQTGESGPILKTPLLNQCGVAGITRERILEIADTLNISAQKTTLTVDDLYQSQELFLCNTLIGIWPVRQLESHHFAVGPVTRQLSAALDKTVTKALEAADE